MMVHLTGHSLDSLVDHNIEHVAHGDYEQGEAHIQVPEVVKGHVGADLDVKDCDLPHYVLRCLVFPDFPQL